MQKNLPYIIIAFGVASLVAILSFLDLYDNFENSLLDLRFKSRGLVKVREDIATVDIDTDALTNVGKWSPWSREKHLPLIKLSEQHDVDHFLFDFYFIEPSDRQLNIKDIDFEIDTTAEQIRDRFPDPDNDLAEASKKAGNIIFAQSFKPKTEAQAADSVKKRTEDMDRRLSMMKEKGYFRFVKESEKEKYSSIFSAYDIEAPVDVLIEESSGVFFFQSDPDPDGLQRRFPLLMLYGNKLFPAASLAMVLRHYNVSFDSVNIEPGKHLSFNINPELDDFGREEINIPINKKGQMIVNWAGPWKDKKTGQFDMMHYPYRKLKEFQELEFLNYVMAKYKTLARESFDGNLKKAIKSAFKLIDADKKDIMNIAKKLVPMDEAEKWIKKNPDGSAKEYKKLPPFMFNEIKNNNLIADAFIALDNNKDCSLDSLMKQGVISYETGLNNYEFESFPKLIKDIENAINSKSGDSKSLKKARAKLLMLERNYLIISNLHRNKIINLQRPLYFYSNPKNKRITVPDGDKLRKLVPFEFTGKKLYYGLTAAGTSDLNPMPFDSRYPMVGLHANALNTILDNRIINEISKVQVALIIGLIGFLLAFGVPALSAAMGGLMTAVMIGAYCWLSFWLFNQQQVWLDMVGPLSTLLIGYLGITVYNYIQEEKNKNFLKESFGTYVSPELIDQMYESGEEPSLGGEEGYHTAFFTDIQSFSAFSEKLTASELVALLNQYLTDMTDVLLENNGTLDKYIGDAIVAFYGAPIDVDNHEYWACKTAIEMQDKLAILREGWLEEGDRWPEIVHNMQNRIGISSGQMVTGNMGSEARMNYTMMGDNVNTAARLESSAKQYGVYIQIADSTYQAVKEKVVVRDLDNVVVMGKNEPVKVWELISEVGKEPDQYKKILPAYHEALDLYKNQEWSKAIDAFKASDELEEMFGGRKTNPSRIYIPRCEHYLENPPGEDWDGVWTLTSK